MPPPLVNFEGKACPIPPKGKCAKCVEDECEAQMSKCFGSDWRKGETLGSPCLGMKVCVCDGEKTRSGPDPTAECAKKVGAACDSCAEVLVKCIMDKCPRC